MLARCATISVPSLYSSSRDPFEYRHTQKWLCIAAHENEIRCARESSLCEILFITSRKAELRTRIDAMWEGSEKPDRRKTELHTRFLPKEHANEYA